MADTAQTPFLDELAALVAPLPDAHKAALAMPERGAFLSLDDGVGAQARFMPATTAFLVCMMHERRRVIARAGTPWDHYCDLAEVLAGFVEHVAINMADQARIKRSAAVESLCEMVETRAHARATGKSRILAGKMVEITDEPRA